MDTQAEAAQKAGRIRVNVVGNSLIHTSKIVKEKTESELACHVIWGLENRGEENSLITAPIICVPSLTRGLSFSTNH